MKKQLVTCDRCQMPMQPANESRVLVLNERTSLAIVIDNYSSDRVYFENPDICDKCLMEMLRNKKWRFQKPRE